MSDFFVAPVSPLDQMAALHVLLGERGNPEQARAARDFIGDDDSVQLLAAYRSTGELCGAMLVQALPGALGVAVPPRGASPAIADALMLVGLDWLQGRGVKVCQVFTEAESDGRTTLQRAGFQHVTQVLSLHRELSAEPASVAAGELHLVRYQPDLAERCAELLLATHEDTQDCPELTGCRTPADVVAAFGSPQGGLSWQFLADTTGELVGLTLVDPSDDPVLQLIYLGVHPRVRRQGVGGQLLRHVLADAVRNGFAAVELTVDIRNEPARRLYQRHGFRELHRREVWLAHLPGEPLA
jgi:ribosomal protein S18 acetylase RimI-like enzyme